MRSVIGFSALLSLLVVGCSGEGWEPAPSALPVVSEPLIGAPAKPVRTIAGLMFDLGGGPPNATNAQNVWMGATNSVRGLYIESSYGMQDIDVDLLGPYTLPVANSCLTLACCGPSSDRGGNGPEVQRIIDSLPMDYMHYGYLYGMQTDSGCGTWGDEGNPMRPAVYSSYENSSLTGGAQEIGHNLGMVHEHTMNCGGQTMPDDLSSCTNVEYGSRLSFMGMGRGHPSAYHKAQQGWLSGCNVVRAGGAGTFTLFPLETACNATQLIQVRAPKSRPAPVNTTVTHYYLELRVPVGYDSMAVNGPQVMIYIAPDLSTANQSARNTFLLDLTPATMQLSDAGLATAGQSFSDPGGGLTFTLDAVSMTSATVTVSGNGSGAHTCVNGMAFTAPGPADCGMGSGGSGMGGAGATGGAGAAGGAGGSSQGGAAGLGGTGGGGLSGSAGSGTTGGGAPTGGTGGATATGGTGALSTGGTATGGGAGASTAGSAANTVAPSEELESGCGCRTTSQRPNGAFLTGLVLFGLLRRRRARA
jgi:MYXO-CTERM domain-containing protein